MVWPCSLCSVFTTLSLKTLVRHITLRHASQPNFKIRCGVNGCQEQYNKMDSFRKHLRRKHKEEMAGNEAGAGTSDGCQPVESGPSNNTNDHSSGESSDSESNRFVEVCTQTMLAFTF